MLEAPSLGRSFSHPITLPRFLLGAACFGIVTRFVLAAISIGSNDSLTWLYYADQIRAHGLQAMYTSDALFNHPPLMAGLAVVARWIADVFGMRFDIVFKIPGILGDALITWALWKFLRERGPLPAAGAAAFYSLNPASILVSGYHGNTDCLCLAMMVLAVVLAHEKRHAFWVGLAVGAAINVKLIGVLLLPLLAVYPAGRRGLRDYVVGLSVAALPFAVVLPFWSIFQRNVLAYNSILAHWGLGLFFLRTEGSLPGLHRFLGETVLPAGRYAILGTAAGIALWQHLRARWQPFESAALILAGFLVFAPGFGIQYIVYPIPFLIAVRRPTALRYVLVSGAFAAVVYYTFWTHTWPAYSHFDSWFHMPSELFGLLAWMVVGNFFFRTLLQPAGANTVSARPAAPPIREAPPSKLDESTGAPATAS